MQQVAALAETTQSGLPAEIVSQYMTSADMHIGGAILFALIGFSLVTGIEIAGKVLSKSKAA